MSETETKGIFTEEIGEMLRSNRFIVGIDIWNMPEYIVCDVIPKEKNKVYVGIRVHTKNIPAIVELQKEIRKSTYIDVDQIKVSFLDARGNVILNEWYNKCALRNIITGPLDYSSDNLLSFYLVFDYFEGHKYELPL